ncbi:sulfonate ABC transporter substrate-binding protein [Derxia gummosa]|uniref:Putative aliphatic sulfonates-binding protein n=1 Tax=Derxia gummosa DSM 723 TaxID=1121388 RepID=A0A8B6X3F7_9BURK|nr:sulfonate ABC transporter substrate-binding protein [Derxia gummosa]
MTRKTSALPASPLRRRALAAGIAGLLGTTAASLLPGRAFAAGTLRIGFQKYGTLNLLRARGTLETALAPQGVKVTWSEFPAGPQMLEALNVGSIDFGNVGEAPPIFAQAAGADLLYVGNQPAAPKGEAIVVPKDSPLKSVSELKGKRVALNKGSNVHYLLVKALEKAGVAYADIQPVFLPPADARAAFERGAVDAWAIWDPFLAAAEKQLGARVLADGTGIVSNHQFFLSSRGYAEREPVVLRALLDELVKLDVWAERNAKEVVSLLQPLTGLDVPTLELSASRYSYGIAPLTPQVTAEQQAIADTFSSLKLIPKPIRIADVVWKPAAAR